MKSDIISIAMGELTTAFDNEVVKAVQKVGIDVDKEELLKALDLYHNLVRCGECEYWKESQYYPEVMVCTYVKGATFTRQHDDYCSRGERKCSEKPNNLERSSNGSR